MTKKILEKITEPGLVIVLAAISRLIPHPPNFTPVGAMALFGGAYLGKKWAVILPLGAMVISDFFIGFDSLLSRVSVYGSFILIGLIGFLIRERKNFANILAASLSSSIIFFLITNFAVWLEGLYPKTLDGLWQSYLMGIPFFRWTFLGDLFYTGLFFGGFELARRIVLKKTEIRSYT